MSTPHPGTRPDNFAPSHKRSRGPSLYHNLLPLTPSPPSYLSSFLSSVPLLSLSPPQIQAVYDHITNTVWVQNQDDMVLLWRRGFFGKGALSRSEPSWQRRVENTIAELEGRAKNLTSEEITAQRRIERKSSKHVKKLEREAEKLLVASAAASERDSSLGTPSQTLESGASTVEAATKVLKGIKEEKDGQEQEEEHQEADTASPEEEETKEFNKVAAPPLWHLEAEHTQLQPEEAFFLLFAIGSLSLRTSSPLSSPTTTTSPTPTPTPTPLLSILSTWQLFLISSATLLPSSRPTLSDPRLNRLDSPFLLSYATYHHYRSMGWVVRSGVKFCCEWVLYGQGGPVGGHAEFAVVVIPNYVDPEDAKTNPFRSTFASDQLAEGEIKNSWRWFNTINRVCSGVKKTLVLLHVVIPPLSSLPSPNFVSENPAQAIAMLQMREVTVRRFLAGRSRD